MLKLLFRYYVHFAWKGRFRNDLYCVGWDGKSLHTHSLTLTVSEI